MQGDAVPPIRDETLMRIAESSVYSGLARVFELDQDAGYELAIRIVGQVAGYVADAAAITGGAQEAARARDGLIAARDDLERLIAGLAPLTEDPA